MKNSRYIKLLITDRTWSACACKNVIDVGRKKCICLNFFVISSLYVCMVKSIIYFLSYVETPLKFFIAKLSICKLGSSSVLIIPYG